MADSPVLIPFADIEQVKAIAQTIRDQLTRFRWELPGKRRFLDVVAEGLGYASFSALTVASKGIERGERPLHTLIREARPTLEKAIADVISNSNRQLSANIRQAIHIATPEAAHMEQHLIVQVSSRYFLHPHYGVVFAPQGRPSLRCMRENELKEVVLVALKTRGLDTWHAFAGLLEDTVDLAAFLEERWAGTADLGIPHELVVDGELIDRIATLGDLCTHHGVELTPATGKNRAHTRLKVVVRDELDLCSGNKGPGQGDLGQFRASPWYGVIRGTVDERVLRENLWSTRATRFPKKPIGAIHASTRLADIEAVITMPRREQLWDHLFISNRSIDDLPEAYFLDQELSWRATTRNDDEWDVLDELPPASMERCMHQFEVPMLKAVRRSWAYDLEDYDYQKTTSHAEGLNPSWYFDARYFGCINLWRHGPEQGLFDSHCFRPNTLNDLLELVYWSIWRDTDATIVLIGDAAEFDGDVYLISLPESHPGRGGFLEHYGVPQIFRVNKLYAKQWRDDADNIHWVKLLMLSNPETGVIGELDALFRKAAEAGPLAGLTNLLFLDYDSAVYKLIRAMQKNEIFLEEWCFEDEDVS